MHMLYNSDSYVVVRSTSPPRAGEAACHRRRRHEPLSRGGYEIVDKFARKEIFIAGRAGRELQGGRRRR